MYDKISITGAGTGGGDGLTYDEVKPLSKECQQPAGIELTPCPAYTTVKSATTGVENETEYEMPNKVAAGANQGH